MRGQAHCDFSSRERFGSTPIQAPCISCRFPGRCPRIFSTLSDNHSTLGGRYQSTPRSATSPGRPRCFRARNGRATTFRSMQRFASGLDSRRETSSPSQSTSRSRCNTLSSATRSHESARAPSAKTATSERFSALAAIDERYLSAPWQAVLIRMRTACKVRSSGCSKGSHDNDARSKADSGACFGSRPEHRLYRHDLSAGAEVRAFADQAGPERFGWGEPLFSTKSRLLPVRPLRTGRRAFRPSGTMTSLVSPTCQNHGDQSAPVPLGISRRPWTLGGEECEHEMRITRLMHDHDIAGTALERAS